MHKLKLHPCVNFGHFTIFQEDIESSLTIVHEVSSQSLGSLCVTEQFRSLTVPIDSLRFESARQKADLAATLLQDLGVAHHNGEFSKVCFLACLLLHY